MEESRVLIWHRDKLKLSIMAEPFLQTVFDHILGRDVVKKLMQVTQVFMKNLYKISYTYTNRYINTIYKQINHYSDMFTKNCKTDGGCQMKTL